MVLPKETKVFLKEGHLWTTTVKAHEGKGALRVFWFDLVLFIFSPFSVSLGVDRVPRTKVLKTCLDKNIINIFYS